VQPVDILIFAKIAAADERLCGMAGQSMSAAGYRRVIARSNSSRTSGGWPK